VATEKHHSHCRNSFNDWEINQKPTQTETALPPSKSIMYQQLQSITDWQRHGIMITLTFNMSTHHKEAYTRLEIIFKSTGQPYLMKHTNGELTWDDLW
jgi:hypothetical protein